jgi:hypothetical protein
MRYKDIFWEMSSVLSELGVRHGEDDFQGVWTEKMPWNTPGPFYAAGVDNSGPGPAEAPNNVYVDEKGFPFVFRQPINWFQLRQVLEAANHDPFAGYGVDGNQHWTYTSIRAWWQERQAMETSITTTRNRMLRGMDPSSPWYWAPIERWSEYLQTGLEAYLRVYAYFQEEGRIPTSEDHLPRLE